MQVEEGRIVFRSSSTFSTALIFFGGQKDEMSGTRYPVLEARSDF
jgi:hypothetical protein